jgi:hypothetical protein
MILLLYAIRQSDTFLLSVKTLTGGLILNRSRHYEFASDHLDAESALDSIRFAKLPLQYPLCKWLQSCIARQALSNNKRLIAGG